MIVESRISFVRLLRATWRELAWVVTVSSLPVASMIYFDLGQYGVHASIPLVIGTAIAIFLGFRTNSAYERWWEARKLWGSIIVDSRNLVRLCSYFIGSNSDQGKKTDRETVRQICYRQIAWARILDRTLKNLPLPDGLECLLGDAEKAAVTCARDPALLLLAKQSNSIRAMYQQGRLDIRQVVPIEDIISRLSTHYGGCQRIKSTVFPVHYTFFTRVFIWIFIVLLGFSLPAHEYANYTLVPAVILIGWVFFMVEGIGRYMQDPFENNRNVIPMEAMVRVIEINLREAIGETDLPELVPPIEGALY